MGVSLNRHKRRILTRVIAVGSVAAAVGGKGGGRPDMAEAGGSNAAALPGALENVYTAVEGML